MKNETFTTFDLEGNIQVVSHVKKQKSKPKQPLKDDSLISKYNNLIKILKILNRSGPNIVDDMFDLIKDDNYRKIGFKSFDQCINTLKNESNCHSDIIDYFMLIVLEMNGVKTRKIEK